MAGTESSIEIRPAKTTEELNEFVDLQQSVWQYPDLDVVPRRMFVVARSIGGQVFGAWDGDILAGYALAIPGLRGGRPYLHSHMLGVRPEYRNRGIGRHLKLAQRKDALARGIDLMEWTFDPLQVKNAHLNIEKLGAIMRRYSPDFYGVSTSPLHGSLPTDRLHAEWWLRSKRVEAVIAGRELPDTPIKETVTVTHSPASSDGTFPSPHVSELELLLRVRRQLQAAFAGGLTVLRFQGQPGVDARYLLGTWDESQA